MAKQAVFDHVGMPAAAEPLVRRIDIRDIGEALAEGWADFRTSPTHLVILGLVYPVVGLVFGRIASGYDALPMIYPLVGGFALIGPIAAVGLYEMSKRREEGVIVTWRNAFDVFRSPRLGSIVVLGLLLGVLFVAWLIVAKVIYNITLADAGAHSIGDLLEATLGTKPGHALLLYGTFAGFLFAVVALTVGVVSIPLVVDRDVGTSPPDEAAVAVRTSLRAVALNPVPIAAWGAVVAAGLIIGAATLLVGFAVVMPVLGHATWHLYRRLVV
jgi:uncharacterized membrane protein